MRPSILVAEEDERVRGALRDGLECLGYDVCEAADGDEAITALRAAPFALVIADISVSGKNGIEIMGYIRKHYLQTPVIIIGTPDDELYLESARALGAAYTFHKPVRLAEFGRTVRGLLVENKSAQST
jgi:DNA-binding response OmpR family regulator